MLQIILAGFLASLIGILQYVTAADKIYWVMSFPGAIIFGTFVNRNHFACYVSMISLITLGSVFSDVYKRGKEFWGTSLRRAIMAVVDTALNEKVLLKVFAFAVIAAAIILSESRSAIVFLMASVILFMSLVFVKKKEKVVYAAVLGILIMFFLMEWCGAESSIKRIPTIFSSKEYGCRVMLNIEAVKVFKDYPVFGIGIGGFSSIFPLYRFDSDPLTYEYLHNDTFQLLVESGMLGFGIFAVLFSIFILRFFTKIAVTRDTNRYCIGLGILSAFLYLGLHSLTDFGLRINAVSSLFVILLAVSNEAMDTEKKVIRLFSLKTGGKRYIFYILGPVAFIWLAFAVLKPSIADIITEDCAKESYFNTAFALNPENDELYFRYYRFIIGRFKNSEISKEAALMEAQAAIDKAMGLNPHKTLYKSAKGQLEFWQGNYKRGLDLLKSASVAEPFNAKLQLANSYMLFLHAADERNPDLKRNLLEKGLAYYRLAKKLNGSISLYSIYKNEKEFKWLMKALKTEGVRVN